MPGKRKSKSTRQKDLTSQYLDGELDEDRMDALQRFSDRSKHQQQEKIIRTALMRAEEQLLADDLETLPVGFVVQVFSLFAEVEHEAKKYLCVMRKTLTKISDTSVVVGPRI